MGNTSKKSIARNAARPARRTRRGGVENAMTGPVTDTGEPAPGAPPSAPAPEEVAQLAFQFFADAGFVHGHALDHWLRAESEIRGES